MIVLVILPVSAFFLLWLFLLAHHPVEEAQRVPWGEKLIQTGLFWSAFLIFGTELLSLFNHLTTIGVVFLWAFAVIVLGIVHWQMKTFSIGLARVKGLFQGLALDRFDWIVLAIVFVTLGILLITGLMSPPSIHDVLTYHMSRIMHWVQNRSLAFFPTSITWQLWMPPFSEMAQLHWQLLAGSDVLSAIHQWYSLILTMVAVSAIAEKLGVRKRGRWLSALFVLTLPIIVLQASGAKNDIVLAFIFASLAYYVVKAADYSLTYLDWICAGVAVGLGVLTKGNFPFFALPLLIWLFIVMLKKVGWKKTLAFAALGMLVVTALNGGHWIRNTQTFGGPFNTGYASFTLNTRFGADVVVSNFSRNVALQLISVGFVNRFVQDILAQIHDWMGIPLFDQSITQGPPEFYYVPTREEVAGNPFHFGVSGLVFILTFLIVFKKSGENRIWSPFLLAFAAIAGMMIFSGVFRWQVWGTRYFMPYYVLFAPVVGFVFDKQLPHWASGLLVLVMSLVLLNPLLNNYSRSFSWSEKNRNSIWRMSRKGLRFANHQVYEGAILELTHLMDLSGCRTYGLEIGYNAPEYLIWGTLTPTAQDYYLEHIAVDNHSAIHASENYNPCGIIVFEVPLDEMVSKDSYTMVEQWQVEPGGGFPLSLYLKPEFIPQTVE